MQSMPKKEGKACVGKGCGSRHVLGFSLIEMAVVLVVISLMVAAVGGGLFTMTGAKYVKAYQKVVVACISAAARKKADFEISAEGFTCQVSNVADQPWQMVARITAMEGNKDDFKRVIAKAIQNEDNGIVVGEENGQIAITVTTPVMATSPELSTSVDVQHVPDE